MRGGRPPSGAWLGARRRAGEGWGLSQGVQAADWLAYWRWLAGGAQRAGSGPLADSEPDVGAGERSVESDRIVGPVTDGDLLWEDSLTGTLFRAKAADLKAVARGGLEALVRKAGPGLRPDADLERQQRALEVLVAALVLPGGPWGPRGVRLDTPEARLSLLPHLPILPSLARDGGLSVDMPDAGRPVPGRLSDWVALRTGLFWALAADEIPPDLWPRLRLHALLDGVDRVCGVPGALPLPQWPPAAGEAVVRAFRAADALSRWMVGIPAPGGTRTLQEALTDLQGRPYRVALVKARTVRIKEYFLQNNKIKAIRGASLLLDSINRDRYPRFFAQDPRLTPEGLVYCGGAGALAVVPISAAAAAAAEWERLHDQVTLAAQGVAVWAEVEAIQLALAFPAVAAQLEALLEERRHSRIPWCLEPALEQAQPDLWYSGESCWPDLHRPPRGPLCHHCGMRRPITQTVPGDEVEEAEDLCLPCAIRVQAGSRRSRFWALYERYVGRRPAGQPARSLDELAAAHGDGRSIAVLYGDGNNMGAVVQRQDNPARLRSFSQRVEQAMYQAVFPALDRHLGSMAVEFIALGGDDLLFIMPAACALETAIAIGEAFEHQFYDPVSRQHRLTLSIGVAIAEYHTPVAHLFDAALQLMKEAKHRSRQSAAALAGPGPGVAPAFAGPSTHLPFGPASVQGLARSAPPGLASWCPVPP